jgi:hypothetical protein
VWISRESVRVRSVTGVLNTYSEPAGKVNAPPLCASSGAKLGDDGCGGVSKGFKG